MGKSKFHADMRINEDKIFIVEHGMRLRCPIVGRAFKHQQGRGLAPAYGETDVGLPTAKTPIGISEKPAPAGADVASVAHLAQRGDVSLAPNAEVVSEMEAEHAAQTESRALGLIV